VVSGTNTIENVTFNNGAVVGGVSAATLQISGTASFGGGAITETGAGGYFTVLSGATVQGRGTINPDVTVNSGGVLKALPTRHSPSTAPPR